MKALMSRAGYTATRYQGDQAIFHAQSRSLELRGSRAGVSRDQTVLVGDSIIYSDSTKLVTALGDTVILRDPSQQSADVIARGRMVYNIEQRRGGVTNIATQIAETGQNWFVGGRTATFVADTTRGKQTAFYVRNGTITSCDDSIPDYRFSAKEIKMVSKNIMVARPAVLYIGDVPIMWLPFIFQDMRSGRRSGVLTPRFGLSEVFRNSPSYRRHVENIGYYFAISDYMNNLDPDVAERPADLVVYGGTGKAARNWDCFDAIVRELKNLGGDETLLVQSGKPVGVFRTHPGAPRVLIANSNLVGRWATWEHFRELERKGLMFFLGKEKQAPARRLIDSGAAVALATDFNPGTSPTVNFPLMLTLAISQLRMSLSEALIAVTVNGAAALNLAGETGQIAPGFSADLALFAIADVRELPYWYGARLCVGSWKAGAPCHPYQAVTKLNPRPPEIVPTG